MPRGIQPNLRSKRRLCARTSPAHVERLDVARETVAAVSRKRVGYPPGCALQGGSRLQNCWPEGDCSLQGDQVRPRSGRPYSDIDTAVLGNEPMGLAPDGLRNWTIAASRACHRQGLFSGAVVRFALRLTKCLYLIAYHPLAACNAMARSWKSSSIRTTKALRS